jgi:hypothetical protein
VVEKQQPKIIPVHESKTKDERDTTDFEMYHQIVAKNVTRKNKAQLRLCCCCWSQSALLLTKRTTNVHKETQRIFYQFLDAAAPLHDEYQYYCQYLHNYNKLAMRSINNIHTKYQ